MNGDLDITSHYRKYFYTIKASTPELQRMAYHLRYQVYYEEQNMISPQDVDNRTEFDQWDRHSIHCLQFHKPSNQPIGNVRLIPLNTGNPHILPIEEHYIKSFDFHDTPVSNLRQGKVGEVSRMAILSSFRRRTADQNYSPFIDDNPYGKGVKRFPINYIPMCLAFTAIILLMEARLDYGAALMEPRLARLLIRFGIELQQIGEPIDYFGLRAPYLIFPEHTYQGLPSNYKALFDLIKQELINS
ncbi:MAG: PEP-CTERM/exosortase system-associated acyltransferase [Gammaproteobacteria bacterium]